MPYPHLSETEILPADGFAGALAGRAFRARISAAPASSPSARAAFST